MDRTRIAALLLSIALAFQIVILIRGEESPGWPIAAIVCLGASVYFLLRPSGGATGRG